MAVRSDAEEGDDPGPEAPQLRGKALAAGYEFRGRELLGGCGGAVHQVAHAIALLEELVLLRRVEQAAGEPGGMQRRPEAIARAREVMAGGGRVQPGVDAYEKDLQVRRNHVLQPLAARRLERRPVRPGG